MVPVLATGHTVSKDGLVYTVKLRTGVKFHDGTDFNAESVKATMDYIKDPQNKSHYLPRWAQVKEVQVGQEAAKNWVVCEVFCIICSALQYKDIQV